MDSRLDRQPRERVENHRSTRPPLIDPVFDTIRTSYSKPSERLLLDGYTDLPDPQVLAAAAESGRILVSLDRRTMPAHFARFLEMRSSPGIIIVSQEFEIGAANRPRIYWHRDVDDRHKSEGSGQSYRRTPSRTEVSEAAFLRLSPDLLQRIVHQQRRHRNACAVNPYAVFLLKLRFARFRRRDRAVLRRFFLHQSRKVVVY